MGIAPLPSNFKGAVVPTQRDLRSALISPLLAASCPSAIVGLIISAVVREAINLNPAVGSRLLTDIACNILEISENRPTAKQFNFGDVGPLVFRAADQSLRGISMRATAGFRINRVLRRGLGAHVGREVLEFLPWLADRDAATAVAIIAVDL